MSKAVDRLKKTFGSLGKKKKKHGSSSSSSSSSSSMNRDKSTTTTSSNEDDDGDHTPFWSLDLDRHYLGDYSFAVIKGNSVIEDYSEVFVGRKSTFIGIYDGHGGNEVAQYVFNNLFKNLMRHVRETGTMSMDSLTQAFHTIETNWVTKVKAEFNDRPLIASIGASCLVGVIWGANLYVANAGGCRAIKGEPPYEVATDHNMKHSHISLPLLYKRRNDRSKFAEQIGETYLIKGRTEFSKSIGDEYLKHPEYNLDEHGFKLNEPLHDLDDAPVASGPFTNIIPLATVTEDVGLGRFIVLASHGFWDIMRDEEVTPIVKTCPQKGIAARLIREALKKVAKREGKSYTEILNVKDESGGNIYHDDITVVVIFFNKYLHETVIEQEVSVRVGESDLSALDNALQGGDEVLERTEPAGDLDQALQGADEGADEALESTQPTDFLDQASQVANVGR